MSAGNSSILRLYLLTYLLTYEQILYDLLRIDFGCGSCRKGTATASSLTSLLKVIWEEGRVAAGCGQHA